MTRAGPALDRWGEGGMFPSRERWAQVWAQPRTLLRITQPGYPIPTPTAKAQAGRLVLKKKKAEGRVC